jgi:LysR family hydrogen peroxide-inducible transcriptional activator
MEIHQLRYFVALAQQRHFQKAADLAHISQPTLSQQIQKLEKELGVYLVERSPRQVTLTTEGERFLPYAVSVLETLTKAETDIKDRGEDPTGRIALGTIPTIGPYLLPSVIKKLKKRASRITLELHDVTTSVLLQHLKEGRIQMGLLALPINERGIASRAVGRESFYLAVSSHHPLAKKKQVTLKDFSREHLLVLQEGHCFRDQSLEYCKLASDSSRIIFQGSSLVSVMRLAAIGEGVTFVPKMAVLPGENPGLRFIRFAAPEPTRELGIVWRMSTPLSRAQNLLMDVVEQEIRRL